MAILYISIGAFTLAIIALVSTLILWNKINKLLRDGSEGLPQSIETLGRELDQLHGFRRELEPYLTSVESRLKQSIRGLHTVRFNPFKGDGSGGAQSFATALVNDHGDGVVLSSLCSRDRMSIFSKPIKSFSSEFELTEEERTALSKAKESCTL